MSALHNDDLRMRREAAGGPSAMRPSLAAGSHVSVSTGRPGMGIGMGTGQTQPTSGETGPVAWTECADHPEYAKKAGLRPVRLWIDGYERSYARAVDARDDIVAIADLHRDAKERLTATRVRLGVLLNSLAKQIGPMGAGFVLADKRLDRRSMLAAMQLGRELGNPDGTINQERVKQLLKEKELRADVRIQLEAVGRPKVEADGSINLSYREALRLIQKPRRKPNESETRFTHHQTDASDIVNDFRSTDAPSGEVPGVVVWTEEEGACEVGAEEPFDWVGVPESDFVEDEDEGEEESGEGESGEEGDPNGQMVKGSNGQMKSEAGEGTPAGRPVPPVPSAQSPVPAPAPARRYSAPVVQMSLAEVYERAAMVRATVDRMVEAARTNPALAGRVAEAFAALEMAAMEIGGGQ